MLNDSEADEVLLGITFLTPHPPQAVPLPPLGKAYYILLCYPPGKAFSCLPPGGRWILRSKRRKENAFVSHSFHEITEQIIRILLQSLRASSLLEGAILIVCICAEDSREKTPDEPSPSRKCVPPLPEGEALVFHYERY